MNLDPHDRYRSIRSSQWLTFGPLSPSARLTLLALMTGSMANLAGIGFIAPEAWARETGLDLADLERALAELEKLPTPARSFLLRDSVVWWARDQLRNSPKVFTEAGKFASENHLKGVLTILGSLPGDSAVVKKFKAYYKLALGTPSKPHRNPSDTPPKFRKPLPTPLPTSPSLPEREREGKPGPPLLSSSGSGNGSSHSADLDEYRKLLTDLKARGLPEHEFNAEVERWQRRTGRQA